MMRGDTRKCSIKKEFQGVYRHPEKTIVAFLVAILLMAAGGYWLPIFSSSNFTIQVAAAFLGALLLMIVTPAVSIRGYHWAVKLDGVHIEEWPRFRFLGQTRRWIVPYTEIKALHRIKGLLLGDAAAELITIANRNHFMPNAFSPWGTVPARKAIPSDRREWDLDRFLETIRKSAAEHGNPRVVVVEGLDFWTRPFGLTVQATLLSLSLAAAGGLLWLLLDGYTPGAAPRSGETAAAAVLFLPFGLLLILRRSLKRRAGVLRANSCASRH
jgi:hypothetical protein